MSRRHLNTGNRNSFCQLEKYSCRCRCLPPPANSAIRWRRPARQCRAWLQVAGEATPIESPSIGVPARIVEKSTVHAQFIMVLPTGYEVEPRLGRTKSQSRAEVGKASLHRRDHRPMTANHSLGQRPTFKQICQNLAAARPRLASQQSQPPPQQLAWLTHNDLVRPNQPFVPVCISNEPAWPVDGTPSRRPIRFRIRRVGKMKLVAAASRIAAGPILTGRSSLLASPGAAGIQAVSTSFAATVPFISWTTIRRSTFGAP